MNSVKWLIKLAKKEYIQDLVENGNMHFSLAKNFRNVARYQTLKGDSNEGRMSKLMGFSIRKPMTDELIPLNTANSIMYANSNECIYCMGLFSNVVKEQNNYITIPMDFFNSIIGKNENYSDYLLLIIKKPIDFINMVESRIKSANLSYKFTTVEYDNHNYETSYQLFSDEYGFEMYSHKGSEYSVQSEYRFIIKNTVNEPFNLSIDKTFFTTETTTCTKVYKNTGTLLNL